MWRFAKAKVAGTSHLKAASPCQDAIACEAIGDGGLILALADGAGSAAHSAAGAQRAVEFMLQEVATLLQADTPQLAPLMRTAFANTRAELRGLATQLGTELREVATTLLAVLLLPNQKGVAAQIGDGAIVVRENMDAWCYAFWPQHGEYVNTTRFLTDHDSIEQLQVDELPARPEDIVLFSDGLERLGLCFEGQLPYDPFFNGVIAPLIASKGSGEIIVLSARLEEFLASPRVAERTDDDVSLIMATRRE